MIVELFGPPCSGKTTFARMLAFDLQARGFDAQTLVSARASEVEVTAGPRGTKVARNRAADGRAQRWADYEALNRTLMRLLPPRSPLWHLRLSRYLRQLAASWTWSDAAPDVVVFDQGYTQALCSLVSLTRQPDPDRLRAALDLLPAPTLRINLTVPRHVLDDRLAQRSRNLTLRERLLELDDATIREQDRICATLFEALDARNAVMRSVSSGSSEMTSLLDAVARELRPLIVKPREPEHWNIREAGRS